MATSHNPFYNLAVENWLFQSVLSEKPLLYLWQNNPCVVIGRAQNPWRECNIEALNDASIPIVRRQSGGGAVYHDLGNLNYTIMSPNDCYDKKANLQMIVDLLKTQEINAHISAKNDILVTHKNQTYKISGSAFRETKNRSFHHGTLLINSDTSQLYNYLHHKIDPNMESKGVPSQRSSVINLAEINHGITPNNIQAIFLSTLSDHITYLPDNLALPAIQTEMNKLYSWDWRFGKTLPFKKHFTLDENDFVLEIKGGRAIALLSSDTKNYQKLSTWIAQNQPIYTYQRFQNLEQLNFSDSEQNVLHYLSENLPSIMESSA